MFKKFIYIQNILYVLWKSNICSEEELCIAKHTHLSVSDNYKWQTRRLITEEVFGSATALWYSPDGRHLAFATFNDTLVKYMGFFHYGIPGSLEDQYPMEVKIKYPKVRVYFKKCL